MWTALAATSVTSSLFLTALAPNVLAVELIRKTTNIQVTWMQWFLGFAPAGIFLLLVLPLLVFVLYPPEVRKGAQAVRWAAEELAKLGPVSRHERLLAGLVCVAILLWVFADKYVHPTTVALTVVGLMLVLGLLSWDEVLANHESWKALFLLATLVTLAGGLSRTGFVAWFAEGAAFATNSLPPTATMAVLLTVYFFSHYLFASITAHVTAMMPIMLAIGARSPGIPVEQFALLLAFSHGLMGVLTPYATTSGPVYLGSGYISTADFWRLGALFGFIFLAGLLGLAAPFLLWGS
jgi:L-tartrate/succinate antiporter